MQDKLPAYQVRESPRAKHIRLKVSPQEGVVVVVPQGFNHALVADIVRQRQPWLRKHLERFAQRRQLSAPQHTFPPVKLELRALNQTWHCHYRAAPGPGLSLRRLAQGELEFSGDIDPAGLYAPLHRWLKQQAETGLVPRLAELSRLAELPYSGATIRCQKTRWGSCSSKGNINLNYKLLFLPPRLSRYVMLHELAHLRHLNHSTGFWRLLEGFEPDYRALDRALDHEAWRYVPEWVGRAE